MVEISEKYKELATAGGRLPFCVIKAGDKTFFDDSIKSFQFQDVVFSEELTFGTACSNRFHFELNTTENIPLSAEIRPYIGFGEYSEEAELCPLGVFYISKRYRRRSSFSITCYDRMYRLEDEYRSELNFPADSKEILREICEKYSLEFEGEAESYTCPMPQSGETVRNILGYLAGLDGANAVFDRRGKLCFRQMKDEGFTVTRSSYTDLDIKLDPITVEKIVVKNDEQAIVKGDGSKLGTYEIYNPFASERTASIIFNTFVGFSYYGLELDMQGLPFLEAGDIITVQNDGDDGLFNAVIGELDFTYDGSFWCRLVSRSKNPVQDSADRKAEEEIVQQVSQELRTVYYNYRSERDLVLGNTLTSLASIDIEVLQETSVTVAAQLQTRSLSDCTLTLTYTVEDKDTPPELQATMKAGEAHPLCLHNFLQSVRAGYVTIRIYGKVSGGTVMFPKGGIIMTVSGQYLAESAINRSPNRTIYQGFSDLHGGKQPVRNIAFQDTVYENVQAPLQRTPAERVLFYRKPKEYSIRISDNGYAPKGVQEAVIYSDDNVLYAKLTFFNPPKTSDASALAGAFKVVAVFSDGEQDYGISEVQWDGNTIMTLTIIGTFVGTDEVYIDYDEAKGDLADGFSGKKTASFRKQAQKEGLV